ncbi:nuclear transport factor 2 family protein [Kordiimonas pumila]|uniref:Nuclear transport factor 2 family protein n=1 Tax=Kordiimonas pumila TaxID=2161677 RepID=A0ABV7D6P2_9PROT|nr:nuclear transport factor 2 family protein [Kordiimonas pumila]
MARNWVPDFYRDADTVDINKLAPWFDENIELRFGNAPPIHGHAMAVETLREFYKTINGMRHVPEHIVFESDTVAVQLGKVIYTTLDGRDISLPVSSHLRHTAKGTLDRLWIYIDIAPLYAPAE